MKLLQQEKRTRDANIAIVQGFLTMKHVPEPWHLHSIKEAMKTILDEWREMMAQKRSG